MYNQSYIYIYLRFLHEYQHDISMQFILQRVGMKNAKNIQSQRHLFVQSSGYGCCIFFVVVFVFFFFFCFIFSFIGEGMPYNILYLQWHCDGWNEPKMFVVAYGSVSEREYFIPEVGLSKVIRTNEKVSLDGTQTISRVVANTIQVDEEVGTSTFYIIAMRGFLSHKLIYW